MKIAALQADSTLAVSTQQTLRLGGHQCTRYLSGRSMIGALRSGRSTS